MVALVLVVPYFVQKFIPYFSFKFAYTFSLLITGIPTIVAYWMVMSYLGPRRRDNVILPGKNIEEYLDIKDPELRAKYNGQKKIPMQVFHDAYFEDKIEVKGEFLSGFPVLGPEEIRLLRDIRVVSVKVTPGWILSTSVTFLPARVVGHQDF